MSYTVSQIFASPPCRDTVDTDLFWQGLLVDIESIIDAIPHNRTRLTDHVDEEAQTDHLSFDKTFFNVLHSKIIEDYPTDEPYLSCMIYGDSFAGEPIQHARSYNPMTQWEILLTVYRSDPNRWMDWRKEKEMKPFDKCPICGGELVEKEVANLLKGRYPYSRA